MNEFWGFVCCICRRSISENVPDQVDIKIVWNEDIKNNSDIDAWFHSHAQCFHTTFSKDFPAYLARMKILKKFDFADCYACEQEIKEDRADPLWIDIIFHQALDGKNKRYYGILLHFDCFKNSVHSFFKEYLLKYDKEILRALP